MTGPDKKLQKNFKSPSTGQLCTLPQYVAEVICLRKCEKENKGQLAFKFWNKNQKKTYQAQIVCANRLIEKYGEDAILSFLKNNKNIYSLGFYYPHKFVDEIICKEAEVLKKKNKERAQESTKIEEKPIDIAPAKRSRRKNNLISQIRKIEDGENQES